ncbi:hypothetical protein THAOC_02687 [Thalassiosira oceanica]|uniref:Uncharacterized protein n=1 Tax=Thalassiosira oceanica TaxID=159749 RepID=K0TQ81_THAOC|nr:hypothetical protein THAOC_02687 [Thalassiosira oceanica]|eukprot:EJK75587.1 hypothetical protein THAOC_02687 [Thalassiosira oceanica]
MEVPRKKAKKCPGDDDTADGGVAASTAAQQQIAELRAELAKYKSRLDRVVRDLNGCKREHRQLVRDLKKANNATERRHKQMVRDQNRAIEWALTVKSIPRDYWLEKGHTGEYAVAMERLLDRFKRIIKELRKGAVGDDRICVWFELNEEEDLEVIADHDKKLMPYWKEFANALVYWSEYHANDKTLEIIIDRIETPDAVLDALRPAMQSKVEYFGFVDDGSPRTWKLAEFIEDILQTNHTVTGVGFASVMLSNEEWKIICNAIRKRIAEQFSIVQCFSITKCFPDGIDSEMLKKILTSSSVEVRLIRNGMSSREAPIIAQCLNSNPPLALLDLRDNRFGDADAAVLANSLSSNTNLTTLRVDRNNFTEEGRLAFLRAIFDISSLASCAASNHNCQVFGLEKDISDLNCFDEEYPNKWEKIFAMLALSGDDSFMNTALLRGIPTYLMPELLEMAGDQEEEGNSKITDLYLELAGTKRCQNHDVWDNLEHSSGFGPINEACKAKLSRDVLQTTACRSLVMKPSSSEIKFERHSESALMCSSIRADDNLPECSILLVPTWLSCEVSVILLSGPLSSVLVIVGREVVCWPKHVGVAFELSSASRRLLETNMLPTLTATLDQQPRSSAIVAVSMGSADGTVASPVSSEDTSFVHRTAVIVGSSLAS